MTEVINFKLYTITRRLLGQRMWTKGVLKFDITLNHVLLLQQSNYWIELGLLVNPKHAFE